MKMGLWYTLAVLAAAPVVLGPMAPARAETLNVGEPQATVFDFVPLHVGVEKGIFTRHGVDVKIFDLRGAAEQQQAMIAGAIDIGLGSGPAMSFSARGAPVKGVAEMASKPLVMVLAVSAKEPIKTAADLKGRTISIASLRLDHGMDDPRIAAPARHPAGRGQADRAGRQFGANGGAAHRPGRRDADRYLLGDEIRARGLRSHSRQFRRYPTAISSCM